MPRAFAQGMTKEPEKSVGLSVLTLKLSRGYSDVQPVRLGARESGPLSEKTESAGETGSKSGSSALFRSSTEVIDFEQVLKP